MYHYTKCPACKSEDFKFALQAKDHTVSGETFSIAECENCHCRFTHPVPEEEQIGAYYKSEDYVSHSDTSKGLINSLYQKVRNYTLRKKLKMLHRESGKEKGRLLDIGCGTGAFLSTMKGAGWDVLGLEPDADARKVAFDKHGISARESSELFQMKDEKFDVITMWHVLEHVHRLDETLQKIHEILEPGGLFIVAVPNYNSGDAERYKSFWAAYDVPRHLYHFNSGSMQKLMDRNGFKIDRLKKMPFDSYYVSMLSEKYKKGSMISAAWSGFASNFGTMNKPERCSSIIYLIRKKQPANQS